MTGVLIRKGKETQTQLEDSHVTVEAVVGVLYLQAKEKQGLLATPECEKILPISEEVWPC